MEDRQWAAHLQADWKALEDLRFIAGARFNHARVEGKARASFGDLSPVERAVARCSGEQCEVPFGYDEAAILPAVSAVYAATGNQNVRASWTRTFSYPEYREMAPLLFFSHQEALETVGNIDLKPTDIYNYDLRWEWFPSGAEIIALSAFYKDFRDPVELRIRQLGSNNRADFVNASSASLYGAETEVRLEMERLHDVLSDFQVLTNFTWIHSEVAGERRRPMQGQSPYLLNAILFYEPFDGAVQMSLLYNKVGRRISKVGVDAFPDVFEEPRETLEYAYTQKLGRGLKSKFTARNLTQSGVVQKQGGLVVKRQEAGLQFTLGVTYAF